ncbi:hypothetical protein A2U01_0075507, partial [Trifolium medium]|nr:hypothetical protein [Trifolium medium]
PFKSSNVDSNVAASGTSEIVAFGNASETLGSDKPRTVKNLGKDDTNPSVDDTLAVEASTKANVNPTVDLVQKVGYETHADQDVTPSRQTSDKPEDV